MSQESMSQEDRQGIEDECKETESLLQQEWAARINLPQLCIRQDIGASLDINANTPGGMRSIACCIWFICPMAAVCDGPPDMITQGIPCIFCVFCKEVLHFLTT